MPSPTQDDKLSFEQDIKPLFRTKDRNAMLSYFDLFDHADVAKHADAIMVSLVAGDMPCDGTWPEADVEKLQRWIDMGRPA
ncbi:MULTISPECIES: hypothetical protein [unclassified Actinomadura]|uniref:hypothetical protein n=1 Tax=unclassified Actinomadura TaxID=2626254 RepID=UPI0011EFE3A8|nr:hypothetical protein [Actinomadura sp. K4S16]